MVYESCLIIAFFVSFSVIFFLRMASFNKITCSVYLDCGRLEVFWSLVPFIFLVCLCTVSVFALYVNDETNLDPFIDVIVVGHQWYWSYELMSSKAEVIKWDSRMVSRSAGSPLNFRDYSEVDRPLVVPQGKPIRVFVTSDDVLHSWGSPLLLMKIDAIPGRLSRGSLDFNICGVFSGFCVELCGAYHAMMPTMIEVVSSEDYSEWRDWSEGGCDLGARLKAFVELINIAVEGECLNHSLSHKDMVNVIKGDVTPLLRLPSVQKSLKSMGFVHVDVMEKVMGSTMSSKKFEELVLEMKKEQAGHDLGKQLLSRGSK
ncbi:cytochrome c oxidase subunit II (mitochondrion) [Ylistrum balloti]|uniref:cytochrome c oxidase subunit II n=1 Tax=Ylistrum balloti TaxID=509963 RepID=UPI00226C914A|nr:cytochrome c oxidase subunit II [Ylistrum balloti]UZN43422.1 cytochrome c oxidase subunit 2 [Ylistrum balloti]